MMILMTWVTLAGQLAYLMLTPWGPVLGPGLVEQARIVLLELMKLLLFW